MGEEKGHEEKREGESYFSAFPFLCLSLFRGEEGAWSSTPAARQPGKACYISFLLFSLRLYYPASRRMLVVVSTPT